MGWSPRLLTVNTYHYRRGGSDSLAFEHEDLFTQAGWSVGWFAMHHPENLSTPWDRHFVDELQFGFEYTPWQKLRMAGKVVYSLEASRKLSALIADWRPDVAHSHCIYHHLSPSVLVTLRRHGIPSVMTAHDLKLACPAYKMLNQYGICERCREGNLLHVVKNRCIHESLAASSLVMVESMVHKALGLYRRYLDKIISPSLFYRQKLLEWGWPSDRVVYIPNFVSVSNELPPDSKGDYFLYFGRLAPEKGVATLIEAAAACGVALKIVGTGPLESELRAMVPENNRGIEFLGYLAGEQLRRVIAGSQAVVLPSEWYENAPMSVLEAYALGKPVIGADVGGIPELVRSDVSGFLFESGNAEDLATRLEQFQALGHSQARELGLSARQLVLREYTAERYLEAVSALYEELGVRSTRAGIAGPMVEVEGRV